MTTFADEDDVERLHMTETERPVSGVRLATSVTGTSDTIDAREPREALLLGSRIDSDRQTVLMGTRTHPPTALLQAGSASTPL